MRRDLPACGPCDRMDACVLHSRHSLFLLMCVCSALAGCGGARSRPKASSGLTLASVRQPAANLDPARSAGVSPPFRFFSSSSFWNVPVVGGAVLDSSSAGVVGAFDAVVAGEQQAGDGPWVNTTKYSVPVYTVGAGQAVVPVVLSGVREPSLSAAWQAVPLPAGAVPAAGTDGTLVLWQPSSDRLWEFHRLVHEVGGWRAAWGGAMQDVSSDAGVFGVGAWPGAQPWWGASASSLSLVGGLISLEDLQRGVIDHALAMAVPDVRAGVFASPAQRSDGKSGGLLALPEGAHLRLNPSLDLAALHLPRLTLMIAEAAQRYGIYVTDWSSVVEFPAQDPTPTGADPYTAPGGYFEGKSPSQLLAAFPWGQLQLLKMDLHSVSLSRRHRREALRRRARPRRPHRRR